MKTKYPTLKLALTGLLISLGPNLQAEHNGHDHSGHDHSRHTHNHADHEDHNHEVRVAGPNGGRIIHTVKPRFEFFVRDDRKIQITFLNDENSPMAPAAQAISAVAGDRSNPTHLTFAQHDGILLSISGLPEGNNVPIILTIKNTSETKAVRERFMVNLNPCPSCDYPEYACTCEH